MSAASIDCVTSAASLAPTTAPVRSLLDTAMRGLVVGIGFSVMVSTSLTEILTSLFMLCWLLHGNFAARWRLIRSNPVALAATGLFLWMTLAMTYSTATWIEAVRCLIKYRDLLYLPLLIPVFHGDARLRSLALYGFEAGALSILGLSYFEWLSGADFGLGSSPNDYVITKDRIIHSLMMAFVVYLSAQRLALARGNRWWNLAVILLVVPNILFMVQGRTGYLLLAALTTLCLVQQFGRRGLVVACLLLAACGLGAYGASETIRARVAQTISQIENQFGEERRKSWDPRLEYYVATVELIGRHPFVGTGTGSFTPEYNELGVPRGLERTTDPHNEYLHLAVQLGIPGACALVWLLVLQWRLAARLPLWESRLARGAALTIGIGSLFNSLLLSITGGLAFGFFGALALADLPPANDSPTNSDDEDMQAPLALQRSPRTAA